VPLVVVGRGPERARLEAAANGAATFLGSVPDAEVRRLYQRARAVLLPGEEDFGIVPVEAQACGRPVIALARGGAVETVVDGVTGLLVAEPTSRAFADALRRSQTITFDAATLRANAERFSMAAFLSAMERQVDDLLAALPEDVRW
jgi:glycosyltransferase involved in cell wall biosynthesis